MEFTYTFPITNTPNHNGRVYTRKVWEGIARDINAGAVPVPVMPQDVEFNDNTVSQILGVVKECVVSVEAAVITVVSRTNLLSIIFEGVGPTGFKLHQHGRGKIERYNGLNYVTDYTITHFSLTIG